MEIIDHIKTMEEKLERMGNPSVGLICTKGALHEGHRQLIETARKENFIVILANILVPREFESMELYDGYPVSSLQDEEMASLAGVDFFFKPSNSEFENNEMLISIKLNTPLNTELNSQGRPGYYENRLTTLVKLLNIVRPKNLYMSDKDIQMLWLAKNLLSQLQYPCNVRAIPAVRDENGMFLSGKTHLLKEDERKQAAEVYKILCKVQLAYQKGMFSSQKLKWRVESEMSRLYLCHLEFAEVVETERLRKIETITGEAIMMVGIQVGKLRLYDWIKLDSKQSHN